MYVVLKFLLEQLPGVFVSLVVADLYFRRQRKLDRAKEREAVSLQYQKTVSAFAQSLSTATKTPLYLEQAIEELRSILKVYQPQYDANALILQAGKAAQERIATHPEEFTT